MKARFAASVALGAALVTVLAGCNFLVPQATQKAYEPSDGVNVTVGDVDVRNALVISDNGHTGNLVLHAVNAGSEDVELTVQYDVNGTKTDVTLELPAKSATDVGYGSGKQELLKKIDAKPGTLLALYFQYGDTPGKQVQVPVLDGSLPQYRELVPTAAPKPTHSATPEASSSPEPTVEPAH
ncbi:MAG TPA: DNA modification methylase [Pseudolysinimonas sp.]|nr:DNA modification methylase [Pseudolysinimonas sp.]